MIKLSLPDCSAVTSYEKCVNGITNSALKARFDADKSAYGSWANYYDIQAAFANLFSIPSITTDGTTVILKSITKNELKELYEYYFVQKQPARKIYDELMVAANDKCPYCGGIGRPRTLDHYLPKAKYPQFSVLPNNLIPCCRDCNSESKQTSIASTKEEQVLHPYFDIDHFFNQQWISARVHADDPCYLEYLVVPPASWSEIDKARAHTHFNDFGLAVRYSVQAAEELATLVDQRKKFMNSFTANQFSDYLMSVGNTTSLFINHWKKVMYKTLAADTWFCNENF